MPFLVLLNFFCYGQQYAAEKQNSTIEFTVTHLGVLSVTGNFSEFNTEITFHKNSIQAKSVIAVNSISTQNAERDKVIKGEAYLDAEKYPDIRFSGSGTKTKNSFLMKGMLMFHGESKTQKLTCDISKTNKTISCSGTLKRSDFNLSFGAMDALIGNEVQIQISMNLVQIR